MQPDKTKKHYAMIAVGPPWPKWQKDARGAQKHYALMTMEEIANLPVGDLATEPKRLGRRCDGWNPKDF